MEVLLGLLMELRFSDPVPFNSEGRFPIPLKKGLGGAIFYDGGNVYDRIGFSRFFKDYSNTVGVGLRYDTPVGPVRIDIGRNFTRPGASA